MHRYFKELNENRNIVGYCSLTYKTQEQLESYFKLCKDEFVIPEGISEKKYNQLRKMLK